MLWFEDDDGERHEVSIDDVVEPLWGNYQTLGSPEGKEPDADFWAAEAVKNAVTADHDCVALIEADRTGPGLTWTRSPVDTR
jgi:hypothetical protein